MCSDSNIFFHIEINLIKIKLIIIIIKFSYVLVWVKNGMRYQLRWA